MIDRELCKRLREEINAALERVGDAHNAEVRCESGTFDDNSVRFKLVVRLRNESGAVADDRAEDFKQYAALYGLAPEDLGREFMYARENHRIVGLRTKARKRPIVAERVRDGKRFIFDEDTIRLLLGKPRRPTLLDADAESKREMEAETRIS